MTDATLEAFRSLATSVVGDAIATGMRLDEARKQFRSTAEPDGMTTANLAGAPMIRTDVTRRTRRWSNRRAPSSPQGW